MIYTKKGDQGYTDLIGERVKKNDIRIITIGKIDEAMANIGILDAIIEQDDIKEDLSEIQRCLFNINSEIATRNTQSFVKYDSVDFLENRINYYSSNLPKLNYFILPGGHITSAHAQVCRTSLRKAERSFITMSELYPQEEIIHKIMNRISDYFFVLARHLNHINGYEDIKK